MLKKSLLFIILMASIIMANGVAVVNSSAGIYLPLKTSYVDVTVKNQVAVVKSTQIFKNTFSYDRAIKYAFPVKESATATNLRWFIDGEWHEAVISPVPQDTTTPGGHDPHWTFTEYLGDTPLFFDIEQPVKSDSTLIVELTYVEFLDYRYGNVTFDYPNDYTVIQSAPVDLMSFNFKLSSGRAVESANLLTHTADTSVIMTDSAYISLSLTEKTLDTDIQLIYSLSLDQLGVFNFSTFQPDSIVPDELGNGYFTFVAEPDPSESSETIEKYFTLIIDESGSMQGSKIDQAKNAAEYIVNNLNEGDRFNLVRFNASVNSFRPAHVDYNEENKEAALTFINNIYAGGSTNISGAFSAAIPQFATASDTTANIVIFFTDGEATTGITYTDQLVEHIDELVANSESNISIFTFGIGGSVNTQLLSIIADHNKGSATFLADDVLEEVITNFYNQIRNPVLLNTSIEIPGGYMYEIYPNPLPNLYKGQQMIVSGRYDNPEPIDVTLKGTAFGADVSYTYNIDLSAQQHFEFNFLMKIWAKQKIDYLIKQYYLAGEDSPEAEELKEEIIELSMQYGVITEFTSFTVTPTDLEEELEEFTSVPEGFVLHGNYPNPFNPSTTIRFSLSEPLFKTIHLKIFNSLGELVRTIAVNLNGSGFYEVKWNGLLNDGTNASSGIYFYVVDFQSFTLSGKMVLLK